VAESEGWKNIKQWKLETRRQVERNRRWGTILGGVVGLMLLTAWKGPADSRWTLCQDANCVSAAVEFLAFGRAVVEALF